MSLRHKVPFVAASLILVVAAGVSAAAYLEARHTALLAARQHVADVVQLVGAGQRTGAQLLGGANRFAARAVVAGFIASPTEANRAALVAAASDPRVSTLIATQLLDHDGQVLLTTDSLFAGAAGDSPIDPRTVADSGTVGRLRLLRDSVIYPVAVRVPGGSGDVLVQWRRLSGDGGGGNSAKRTQQVLGARMLLGNIDGSYWTDLSKVVPSPPPSVRGDTAPVVYTRVPKDGPVIAAFMPLAGTPWVFSAEVPEREAMASANALFGRIGVITLFGVILGGIAAWAFALRLTTPLSELTSAADAIAAGRPIAPVRIARSDELGHLASAFATMTEQVRDGWQRLEDKVAERTATLNQTLQQLQDTQATLVRREKAAMLGQLAAGVGHELRNPLGVMSNAVYYLDFVLTDSRDDVRDYLRILREQVTLATRIVTDLLDSARVAPANRRATPVEAIVETQLERLPRVDDVRIALALDPELPPADVDPVHIGQAVYNLLTNALQALGPAGGEVTIRAEQHGDEIALTVQDTGPGIEPAALEQIFEPLFTTKPRGIGLGLSVSRALVQANGGDIAVSSVPGQGAAFTITMPVTAGAVV